MKTQEESSPKACRISTLFAGDFLVRVFQSLENEGALKMPEERCSLKSLGLPALKDLAFSSLKTFPDSYRMTGAGRLRPSSVRWMNWGICSDARENFEYNKLSLARKAEKEENLKVQLLLRRDMKFLDDIQLQMSTAREFMFAYRITHESEDGALATLNRIEKNISDQGFEVKRADKDDIKRFLSRYFGHMTEDAIDDVDGERMIKKWIIPD